MNAQRLINMILRRVMRMGMRKMAAGRKPSAEEKQAQQAARMIKRTGRM